MTSGRVLPRTGNGTNRTPGVTTNATDVTDDETSIATTNVTILVIGIILLGSSLYVMVAVIMHRVKTNRINKQEFRASTGTRKHRKESTSPWLGNLSVAACVLAFLNCCSDRTFVYAKETSDVTCKVMQCFSFLFYGCGISCLYSFLWIRQRACYKSPSLTESYGKLTRFCSTLVLPLFLVMMLAGMVLTASLWTFESSKIGCVETSRSLAPLGVLFAGSLVMQITLLGLFVYPLKRHIKIWSKGSLQSSTEGLLSSLVHRSIATTGLCIATDSLAFILAITIKFEQFIFINYIYDANLICNVIFVIGSYADWRRRLCVCCQATDRTPEAEPKSFKRTSTYKVSTNTAV